jgi:acyl-CoA thioester hydrolase
MPDHKHIFKFRVAYADTDQMGIMHHLYYLRYFEMARHELMRDMGVSYAGIEKGGVFMPVIHALLDYKKPAHFDQGLTIESIISSHRGPRIVVDAFMRNKAGEIICSSKITLAYVSKLTGKACFPPAIIKSKLLNLKN